MAGEQKMVFGSTTTVISLTDNMLSTTNTYDAWGAGLTMTQLDNSAGYPLAKAVLNIPAAFASPPTATDGRVDLFMIEDDIDGTDDETEPASGDIEFRAKLVGCFVIDNANVAHRKAIVISLQEARKARFYVRNNVGTHILASGGSPLTVKVTPFTYGAAA